MAVMEWLSDVLTTPSVVILGAITLFEVVPIRINPWSALFKWIGNIINADMRKELSELKQDFEEKKVEDMRWEILNFANSCRRGNEHSKDEWWHLISQLSKYEEYTELKHITNGVIEEDAVYLRELYHDRNLKNDFL